MDNKVWLRKKTLIAPWMRVPRVYRKKRWHPMDYFLGCDPKWTAELGVEGLKKRITLEISQDEAEYLVSVLPGCTGLNDVVLRDIDTDINIVKYLNQRSEQWCSTEITEKRLWKRPVLKRFLDNGEYIEEMDKENPYRYQKGWSTPGERSAGLLLSRVYAGGKAMWQPRMFLWGRGLHFPWSLIKEEETS